MTKSTQAWWVCNVCKKSINKVGKPGHILRHDTHRQTCVNATYSIKRI